MVGPHRKTSNDLARTLAELSAAPYRFGFYNTLRLMECFYWDKPRLGASQKPGEEPIRLGQEPTWAFAPAGLAAFGPGEGEKPHRLSVHLLGLLGTNGPLPLHLTEYIQDRRRRNGDQTLIRFLDMFHHRMLSLFYRAWANNEPTVSYDRPEDDRFGSYMGALAGFGLSSLRQRDAVDDETKNYYCGRFAAQTRCPEGLQAVLADYFDVPIAIEEFIGEWLPLPSRHVTRLGIETANSNLGGTAIAGTEVWSCQHKFRIHMGPLDMADYRRFLPAGDRMGRLVPLVRNYMGDELAWDLCLILKREEIPPTCLDGTFRLGWTTWLGEKQDRTDAGDLVLDAFNWLKGGIA